MKDREAERETGLKDGIALMFVFVFFYPIAHILVFPVSFYFSINHLTALTGVGMFKHEATFTKNRRCINVIPLLSLANNYSCRMNVVQKKSITV